MAENNEYIITIKRDTKVESDSPVAGNETESSGGLLSKKSAKVFAQGMVAYRQVKALGVQAINHEVSLVQLRTGSNELQQRADFINDVVQKGVGALESVAVGALVGGVGGALAGLAMSGVTYAIQIQQKRERLDLEREVENESIRRNLIRAGASNSRANQLWIILR